MPLFWSFIPATRAFRLHVKRISTEITTARSIDQAQLEYHISDRLALFLSGHIRFTKHALTKTIHLAPIAGTMDCTFTLSEQHKRRNKMTAIPFSSPLDVFRRLFTRFRHYISKSLWRITATSRFLHARLTFTTPPFASFGSFADGRVERRYANSVS